MKNLSELNLKRRWDIYLNGTSGAKELTVVMLTMWRHLLPASGLFGEALVEAIKATARVCLVIVLPFFFWLVPVIAIFTAHRTVPDEEIRERLRASIHKNGRDE